MASKKNAADQSARIPQNNPSRRSVLRGGAIAASAAIAFPYVITGNVRGANEKIRVACVGVGGKGGGDTDQAAEAGGEIVAICDVDDGSLAGKIKKYPGAKVYKDFRKMF